ncbi:ABC-2 type transport system ATP-binding protein [Croceifilum oryzae]|uniref:ABC-2 type transport system ATP-binding protein n=1 Tax=Croceifilum oryzae TaxID=1553429 RepID=A0AAJ1TIP3_9BACL|nr:ABC transporter ATP-binding protein [Croceifilum oryzae]MDQ0417257.1 ABC-2 type transport system ATP-binding protein [Croceifilum oryzae]
MKQAVVKIENLTKVIKDKTIIDQCSFELYPGEIVGFLGPNGAGKTTTIRMLVGLMKPTSGDIVIQNHHIERELEMALRHVGAIVENPELYKHLTGYQNLELFWRMSDDIPLERIDEVVKMVRLEGKIHEKVKTYSLGMRQRLGLAQALLHKPSVLILDELNNGLDPAGIKELRSHLQELADQHDLAILVSSHLLSEMELLCDQIVIIQNGKIIGTKQISSHEEEETEGTTRKVRFKLSSAAEEVRDLLSHTYPDYAVEFDQNGFVITLPVVEIPKLNKRLVQNDIDVFEIQIVEESLEDQFLQMTGGRTVE